MDDGVNEMDDYVNEMDDCETHNKILLWSERKAGVIAWTVLTKVVELAIQDLSLWKSVVKQHCMLLLSWMK